MLLISLLMFGSKCRSASSSNRLSLHLMTVLCLLSFAQIGIGLKNEKKEHKKNQKDLKKLLKEFQKTKFYVNPENNGDNQEVNKELQKINSQVKNAEKEYKNRFTEADIHKDDLETFEKSLRQITNEMKIFTENKLKSVKENYVNSVKMLVSLDTRLNKLFALCKAIRDNKYKPVSEEELTKRGWSPWKKTGLIGLIVAVLLSGATATGAVYNEDIRSAVQTFYYRLTNQIPENTDPTLAIGKWTGAMLGGPSTVPASITKKFLSWVSSHLFWIIVGVVLTTILTSFLIYFFNKIYYDRKMQGLQNKMMMMETTDTTKTFNGNQANRKSQKGKTKKSGRKSARKSRKSPKSKKSIKKIKQLEQKFGGSEFDAIDELSNAKSGSSSEISITDKNKNKQQSPKHEVAVMSGGFEPQENSKSKSPTNSSRKK